LHSVSANCICYDTLNLTVTEIRRLQHTCQLIGEVSHIGVFNILVRTLTLYVVLWMISRLDVHINARRIKFVEDMHKYRHQHAILHKLYMFWQKRI